MTEYQFEFIFLFFQAGDLMTKSEENTGTDIWLTQKIRNTPFYFFCMPCVRKFFFKILPPFFGSHRKNVRIIELFMLLWHFLLFFHSHFLLKDSKCLCLKFDLILLIFYHQPMQKKTGQSFPHRTYAICVELKSCEKSHNRSRKISIGQYRLFESTYNS